MIVGQVWSHKLTSEEVAAHFPSGKLLGSWGGVLEVAANDAIVMPFPHGGEVYCINEELFDDTYRLVDRRSHVPTQEELLVEWTAVLQDEAGSLHREAAVVFAKRAVANDAEEPGLAAAHKMTHDHHRDIELWLGGDDDGDDDDGTHRTHEREM